MWFLFPSCRKKKFAFLKANESWSCVLFVDPIVIPIVLLLRRFKNRFPFYMITPNALSLFSFIIFFLTVILMFLYPDGQTMVGWGFVISSLVDDIDGRLARATQTANDFGALVDSFFDMFRTSIGLALIGLALARAHHSYWIFPLMTFYCLIHGAFHMNQFTKVVMAFKKAPEINGTTDAPKTAWQHFCDRRGFVYTLFTEYEATSLIFLSIVFLRDPVLPIAVIIFFRLLYWPIAAVVSSKTILKRLQ